VRSDTRCPGCGARNAPDARNCEWCGRPFLLRDQRRQGRALWTFGTLVCIVIAAVVVALALLSGAAPAIRGLGERQAATATPLPPTEVPLAPTAEPPGEADTPDPAGEYVRVVNTGGQGIVLRREPSTTAPRVVARAENAILRVTGPDAVVDGRTWRQVEDAQGNRGWTPAEFLAPAPGAVR